MGMFDEVLAFMRVVATSVDGSTSATMYNVAGIAGLDSADDDDDEVAAEQPAFSALGMIGRPLPPANDVHCDSIGARTSDGFVPFGYRDTRLHAAFPNPGEGTLAWAHYGGGFDSMDLTAADTGDQKGTIRTLYCPYEYAAGTPAKAHAVTLDPGAGGTPNVQMVHGEGHFISMTDTEMVLAFDSSTFIKIEAGKITFQANDVLLPANVVLGGTAGVALVPTSASTKVFIVP